MPSQVEIHQPCLHQLSNKTHFHQISLSIQQVVKMVQMPPNNTTTPATTSVPSTHNPPPTHSSSLKILEHVPPSTTTHIHPVVTRLRDGIRKLKMLLATKHPISVDVALADPLHDEPTCVTKAAKHSHWRATMNSEFNAFIHNGTWVLTAPQ